MTGQGLSLDTLFNGNLFVSIQGMNVSGTISSNNSSQPLWYFFTTLWRKKRPSEPCPDKRGLEVVEFHYVLAGGQSASLTVRKKERTIWDRR